MAAAAREAMGKQRLRAYADRGYFNGPKSSLAQSRCHGLRAQARDVQRQGRRSLRQADFIYIVKDDEYQCPAGERAIYRFTRRERAADPPLEQ